MQNILTMWKIAESEWVLCQDRKDDLVPIKNTLKYLSTISLGVDKHKSEDFAHRTLREPYLKQDSGEHNNASIKPAQALDMLESGVWDLLVGDGKRYFSGSFDDSNEQASKLSHHLPPRATGVWQLVQGSLISGRSSTDRAVLPVSQLCCTKLQTIPVQFLASLASP